MAYNEQLADRIRKALEHIPNVEEKKMFRGVTFMVNDKMCISVSGEELMCRIDPQIHEEVIQKPGCRTMEMKDRTYKGYVYVSETGLKTQTDFDYWIALALDFNQRAKSSKKSKK